MRIGLVLAATPPYSETFFKNKIRILKEHGYDVFLLTDRKKGNFEECEERIGFSVEGLSVSILIKTIFCLYFVCFRFCFNLYFNFLFIVFAFHLIFFT